MPDRADNEQLIRTYGLALSEQLKGDPKAKEKVALFLQECRAFVARSLRPLEERDTVLDISNAPMPLPHRRKPAA
jgi:hypothetical protein